MEEILNIILKNTYSLSQLKHRLRILKSNLLKTFFGGENQTLNSTTQDLNWLESLPENFYRKFTKDNIYQIFADLEKKISNLPTLAMYLTFEPNDTTLYQVGSVARKTFNYPSLILDIKLDPNLIAGAALVWKGVYKDYSLRAKVENRKAEIIEGFKKYLK
ncbi:hypothetical protein KKE78_04405 [Patescibacteria group bacterium]|nr:hypothetical protein [Patescibacteria group bacterium]